MKRPDQLYALKERLELGSTPEPNSGCILWNAALTDDGYGTLSVKGKQHRAHRVAYELEIGPIPPGLQPDHLCRTHSCINTRHMELVTSRENTLRGVGITAQQARRTACPRGHPYSPVRRGNSRVCRICDRLRRQRYTTAPCPVVAKEILLHRGRSVVAPGDHWTAWAECNAGPQCGMQEHMTVIPAAAAPKEGK